MIGTGVAWFLAWLFGRAALHKAGAPDYYRKLVESYAVALPARGAAVFAIAALEAAVALALLLPQWRGAGLIAAALLLLGYAALMAVQILRGRAGASCGCAGPDSELGISWALVLRNGACAALALLAATPAAAATAGWPGLAVSLGIALFAALVYATCEQLIGNAQWMAGES